MDARRVATVCRRHAQHDSAPGRPDLHTARQHQGKEEEQEEDEAELQQQQDRQHHADTRQALKYVPNGSDSGRRSRTPSPAGRPRRRVGVLRAAKLHRSPCRQQEASGKAKRYG